jgi:DNA-directed RNA polymerase specialized sigma24 family protein
MGIDMEELPKNMNLWALADRCMSEINNFRRGEASSDQYCLEIFRRAMLEHDEEALESLVNRFQEFLLSAFRRHPRSEAATHLDSPENYVARAFERFWIAAVHNQQLEFTTLAAALRYLRVCLDSTILDMLRANARAREVPLPESGFAGEPAVEDQDEGSELWEVIRTMLPGERERRLAFLLYQCNLKPREIVRLRPQEFPDVNEIHRMKRNIVDRLARSADLIRYKLSSEV